MDSWLYWSFFIILYIIPQLIQKLLPKIFLPGRESNPGLPRDRRRYSPLYYQGRDVWISVHEGLHLLILAYHAMKNIYTLYTCIWFSIFWTLRLTFSKKSFGLAWEDKRVWIIQNGYSSPIKMFINRLRFRVLWTLLYNLVKCWACSHYHLLQWLM